MNKDNWKWKNITEEEKNFIRLQRIIKSIKTAFIESMLEYGKYVLTEENIASFIEELKKEGYIINESKTNSKG